MKNKQYQSQQNTIEKSQNNTPTALAHNYITDYIYTYILYFPGMYGEKFTMFKYSFKLSREFVYDIICCNLMYSTCLKLIELNFINDSKFNYLFT